MNKDEIVALKQQREKLKLKKCRLSSKISVIDKQLSDYYDAEIRKLIREYGVDTDDYIVIEMPDDGFYLKPNTTVIGLVTSVMLVSIKLPKEHIKYVNRIWPVTIDTILQDSYEKLNGGRGNDTLNRYFSESHTNEVKDYFLNWLTNYSKTCLQKKNS